jgi:hypothetical protein
MRRPFTVTATIWYPLDGARTLPVTSTDRAAVELPSRGAVMVTRLVAGARGDEASPPHPHPPTSAPASARRHPAPIDLGSNAT